MTIAEPERVALLDLDGSLADYDGRMREELKKIMAPSETLPDNPWDAEPYWEARMDLIKRQPGFWRRLKPIEVGMQIYFLLLNTGFRCVALTKGPRSTTAAWTEKVQWCQRYIPEASITITEDKGLVYGRVLYDDWPKYIKRWLQWRPRGLVIMRDTSYNQDFSHPQVVRVYDGPGTRNAVVAQLDLLSQRLKREET